MRKFIEVCAIMALLCMGKSFASTINVATIADANGSRLVTVDSTQLRTEPRSPGQYVYGVQNDTTIDTTITFYGYVDSWAISSIGGDSSFTTNFSSGSKIVASGYSVGDNLNVCATSPSVYTITVGTSATLGYIIKGIFFR